MHVSLFVLYLLLNVFRVEIEKAKSAMDASTKARKVFDDHQGSWKLQDTLITEATMRQLGNTIAPSLELKRKARLVMKKVVDALHGSALSVDRAVLGGSLGKATSLGDFDMDIVLLLNKPQKGNEEVSLTDFLISVPEYLREVMRPTPCLNASQYSATFVIDGIKVDVLPALNFAQDSDLQRNITITHISNAPPGSARDLSYTLSAGLVDSVKFFLQKRSSYVKATVRVCKLWKLGMIAAYPELPRFISYVVELLAVKAAELEEQKPGRNSVLSAFRTFLQYVIDLDSRILNIVWEDNYSRRDVPSSILQQRPLLLDPTNPYNNLAQGYRKAAKAYSALARETLAVLAQAVEGGVRSKTLKDLFIPKHRRDVVALLR